jgi:hypothetical protein
MKKTQTLVNWQKLALNLRKHKPLSTISKEIGCEQMTLQRLARGDVAEPRFDLGLHLLNYHLDLYPEKHQELLNLEKAETL